MKKTLVMVIAVAGYALVEIALLLSDLQPPLWSRLKHPLIVSFGQLLLIFGMAALISLIINGPHRWRRRMLGIVLVGALFVPGLVCMGALGFALHLLGVPDGPGLTFIFVLLVAVGIAFGLFMPRKAEREAAQRLAERESGMAANERRSRALGIRISSCIPVTLVALVLLFFPQVWAFASHFNHPNSRDLPGYRVNLPATWILTESYAHQDGSSNLSGLAVNSTNVMHLLRFRDALSSFSNWGIGTAEYLQTDTSKREPVMRPGDAQHIVQIGTETITCVDHQPLWVPPSFIDVSCLGSSRIRASFFGPSSELPAFYRMLGSVTQVK